MWSQELVPISLVERSTVMKQMQLETLGMNDQWWMRWNMKIQMMGKKKKWSTIDDHVLWSMYLWPSSAYVISQSRIHWDSISRLFLRVYGNLLLRWMDINNMDVKMDGLDKFCKVWYIRRKDMITMTCKKKKKKTLDLSDLLTQTDQILGKLVVTRLYSREKIFNRRNKKKTCNRKHKINLWTAQIQGSEYVKIKPRVW